MEVKEEDMEAVQSLEMGMEADKMVMVEVIAALKETKMLPYLWVISHTLHNKETFLKCSHLKDYQQ